MSVRIRPAFPDDRDRVVTLLHERMNPKIPRERWRRLFDYSWRPADAPDCGRILEAEGRLAGFLGATYVDRRLGDRVERICNMSSWYLLPEHRGRGVGRAMALDLTRTGEITATDLTATPQVHRLLLAHCGFSILDDRRWLFRKQGAGGGDATLVSGAALAARLEASHRAMIDHHAAHGVLAIGVEVDGSFCLLLLQVKRHGADIAYHQLLYASAPKMLARHAQAVADALLPEGAAVLAIDRRLLPGGLGEAETETEAIPQPRLYKSTRMTPADIDNLYNEVLLLDQKLP